MKHALILFLFIVLAGASQQAFAQQDTIVHRLTLRQEMVEKGGRKSMGMTINGSIPGPTLDFKEGAYAVIYVTNEMDVETSVHWHGLLLPNFYDGVPYLTTPPIMPGETFKYEYPLIQSGTYWYHSHTMLQEQSGVYGSIVIQPENGTELAYDREQVVVLSDWTHQKPMNVLRNLKRGNEWYNIKKGTATPLNRVIARGALGAQFNFWKQRMESADIADIYYPAFLANGEERVSYGEYEPGEKVRLRIINGSASSQFWLTFGGGEPTIVSADGLNVVPVRKDKVFIAIAETYDIILTIPESGSIEMRATAQDGSGYSSTILGSGPLKEAPETPRPDKIGMMMQMAKMDMRMGAPAMKFNPSETDPQELMEEWGMQMEEDSESMKPGHEMKGHSDEGHSHHSMDQEGQSGHEEMDTGKEDKRMKMEDQEKGMSGMGMSGMDMSDGGMGHMDMFSEYTYDYLKATESTAMPEDREVKEILLNLTGNMWRYVWSMNGVPLSEADQIRVERGTVARITLNNLTMMHHPMHLHGHFFRVINEHGEYSPLKHTVNVPPMNKVTIEFNATEDSDWFFHCHVLYHMMGGMARIFSYGDDRDPRLKDAPLKVLVNEGRQYYTWGTAEVGSHMAGLSLVSSNTRNQFNLSGEFGYNENMEAEFTYERYLYDYLSVFAGVNMENEGENSLDELEAVAIGGIRFFTPYMFNLDVRLDHKLRPEVRLSRELMIFPRTTIFGNIEYQADFGWVNDLENEATGAPMSYMDELVWSAGMEYFLSRNFSLMGSYDSRFGGGGGLSIRF
ncbi:multicopper oxidase domain-containing protein [Roseivirga sp. BDSF3-8]|uniref:multicopper oxidase domain-containing protein n=1 Tax=Roseivirga sp. BDSF3-8 TaxID=3241598 RepID=UPI003531B256